MAASLRLPVKCFDALRDGILGPELSPSEVDGCNAILTAMDGLPISFAAYALATAFHETNHTLQPVRELGGVRYLAKYDTGQLAIRLGNTPQADGDGQLYCGRGYVQITGRANYQRAQNETGVLLVRHPDLALEPGYAAAIMRRGMEEGWFTGKKLETYLPSENIPATREQFAAARRIINGVDRANLIATYALAFQGALFTGRWGE